MTNLRQGWSLSLVTRPHPAHFSSVLASPLPATPYSAMIVWREHRGGVKPTPATETRRRRAFCPCHHLCRTSSRVPDRHAPSPALLAGRPPRKHHSQSTERFQRWRFKGHPVPQALPPVTQTTLKDEPYKSRPRAPSSLHWASRGLLRDIAQRRKAERSPVTSLTNTSRSKRPSHREAARPAVAPLQTLASMTTKRRPSRLHAPTICQHRRTHTTPQALRYRLSVNSTP